MTSTNWMLVSSPDNFERARTGNFSQLAMKSRHIRKAERVRPGDRVLFYVTGQMAFAGTFTVTSTYVESHEPLFTSKKDGEDYPFRFSVVPNVILRAGNFVSAASLLGDLDFVKKWPSKNWNLAFQGHVHTLSDNDFGVIEGALDRVKDNQTAGVT